MLYILGLLFKSCSEYPDILFSRLCDNCSSISTSHPVFFVFILGFGLVWLFISWVWVGWGGWDSYLASFIVLGRWAVYGRNGIDYS